MNEVKVLKDDNTDTHVDLVKTNQPTHSLQSPLNIPVVFISCTNYVIRYFVYYVHFI